MNSTKRDLTFRHNLKQGRHGWLRLTPAYSIKVVGEILDKLGSPTRVLDPFSGTGTTGLVCSERGFACDLIDINPFLAWLSKTKIANYSGQDREQAQNGVRSILATWGSTTAPTITAWVPPISNITRWWAESRLAVLARLYAEINRQFPKACAAKDLLLIGFCQVAIEYSNAAFNHQSMSFKPNTEQLFDAQEEDLILDRFVVLTRSILTSTLNPLPGQVRIINGDARHIPDGGPYDAVITSPPYPNRMSYIRELRPYMYWLGYLHEPREAGELDWQAIGGTWGVATSRLQTWTPTGSQMDDPAFPHILEQIAQRSRVLSKYVHRYFADMATHLKTLFPKVMPGGKVFYIVGNSKFYDTLVPVEQFYAHLMRSVGFQSVEIKVLRKRNSKKELFEYIVSAEKPG